MNKAHKTRKTVLGRNSLGRRIFRIILATVIVLSFFFTLTSVFFVIRASVKEQDRLYATQDFIFDDIYLPMLDEKDQSVLDLTVGNAKGINRFFEGCMNMTELVVSVSSRLYTEDKPVAGDVIALAEPGHTGEQRTYRLNASTFDESDPETHHTLEVMSRLRHVLISICRMDNTISSVYFSSTDGFTLFADGQQEMAINEHGSPVTFDADTRGWYQKAVAAGEPVCSSLSTDYFSGKPMVTISAPVYAGADGNRLIGVAAVDVNMDTVVEILDSSLTDLSEGCVVTEDGELKISTATTGPFGLMPNESKTLNKDTLPTMQGILRDVSQDKTGLAWILIRSDGNEFVLDYTENDVQVDDSTGIAEENPDAYKVFYAPIPILDWSYFYIVDANSITAAIDEPMMRFYETASQSTAEDVISRTASLLTLLALLIVTLIAMYGVSVRLADNVTKPIVALTKKVREIKGDHLDFTWEMQADEETQTLAESFGSMTRDIRTYIRDLATVTAEKERIGAELDVARKIQADMLPTSFPERPDLKLYASMTPAKEVGGDFYDFFSIGEEKMAFVVADVSGKGVPAALFMAIAKSIIKNNALSGEESPKEILALANQMLCEGNDAMLFVTTWIGILNLATGEMICANAGHEYPMIRRAGGEFELYKDHHDVPLAVMEGMGFHEYTITLGTGDAVFLYTDGFPESMNESEEQFTEQRMLDALNEAPSDEPKELDERLRLRVSEFVGGASQFDDMTALGITYLGTPEKGRDS